MQIRKRDLVKLITLSLLQLPFKAQAQTYPDRPIRVIMASSAGGAGDTLLRHLQEPLSRALGQPIVVEYRPGAAGAIGTRILSEANPDGHTLGFVYTGPMTSVPILQKDAGYDPVRDFSPISFAGASPMVLVAHSSLPATDMKSFIAYAQTQKQGINMSNTGTDSFGHLSGELLARKAGINLVQVPYKGWAPAVHALLAGEVQLFFSAFSETLSTHIKSGKIKVLGVSSERANPLMPDFQPIGAVLPGFSAELWFAMVAPAKTPEHIVKRLNEAMVKVLASPEVRQKYAASGFTAESSTPKQLGDRIQNEYSLWKNTLQSR